MIAPHLKYIMGTPQKPFFVQLMISSNSKIQMNGNKLIWIEFSGRMMIQQDEVKSAKFVKSILMKGSVYICCRASTKIECKQSKICKSDKTLHQFTNTEIIIILHLPFIGFTRNFHQWGENCTLLTHIYQWDEKESMFFLTHYSQMNFA